MSERTVSNATGFAALGLSLVMGGCFVASVVFGERPNRALEGPIAAHDLATVRRLIEAGGTDGRVGVAEVQLAATALTPRDARSVEVFRLVLQQPTASPRPLFGDAPPSPANLTLTLREPNGEMTGDTSPAELAARQWSAGGLRVLLELGLDVKSVAVSGALVHAAANGCEPCLTALLDAGADVNGRDRHGDTALAMAQRVGNTAIADVLTRRGALAR